MNPPDPRYRAPAPGRPEFHPPVVPPAAAPGGLAVVPADPLSRFGARLIDNIVATMLTVVAALAVTGVFAAIYRGDMDRAGPEYGVPMILSFVGAPFLYEWLQIRRWGCTLGKRALGLRVVRVAGGGPVPPGHAALRALCYSPGLYYLPTWIPIWSQLNVLWMLWDKPHRQCLHDKIAKTAVVKVANTLPPMPPYQAA